MIRKLIGDPPLLLEEMPNCPGLFHYYREMIATGHKRVPGGWEWGGEFFPDYLTVGGASYVAIYEAKKYLSGEGLDIGAGYWPYPNALPIDPYCWPNNPSIDEIPLNSQDYIFSSHTLEHISDWNQELRKWTALLKKDGVLFLYLPHPKCGLWRMENPFMSNHHKWVPTPEVVAKSLIDLNYKIIARNDGPDIMMSFFICGRKH